MRPIALDSADIGIARLVVALEHIEHRCPRKQQLHTIGALDEPIFDITEILRVTKRRKHSSLIRRWLPFFPPTASPDVNPATHPRHARAGLAATSHQ